jgi:ribosomal protein L32
VSESPAYYCPNPECGNVAFSPGVCSGCGATLAEEEADSPSKSEIGRRVAKLLAEMPEGRQCPRCGGSMVHGRLTGYRCFRGCQP